MIPVLIVGAGPVGLSLALALARQGIDSIVIEQHPSTTNHPKARGVNVRTMELFRQWGNAPQLLQQEQPREAIRFIWAHSLQGKEITRVALHDGEVRKVSPAQTSFISQDRVEESLLHRLSDYPKTEVRFSNTMISFREEEESITIRVFNKKTQQEESLRARYLIAADGAHSSIRKQLGIEMKGPENLGQFCSVYCEMDLSPWTQKRPAIGYFFTDPKIRGRFLGSVDGVHRWIMGLRFSEETSREIFTLEYCLQEIKRVLDLPHLEIKIINRSFWTMASQIASRYRHGRVLLTGDAAHILPPTGGFGMNTGIQDAHNLAWKLAFVVNGHASERLLDTYYEERAPVAAQNASWSLENAHRYTEIYKAIEQGDEAALILKLQEQQKNLNYIGLDLGFIYHSKVLGSENNQRLSVTPSTYQPTTVPGSRAPHVLLRHHGKIISTLDLFEKEMVLLVGSEGILWLEAAASLQEELSIPFRCYRVAEEKEAVAELVDQNGTWHESYEITRCGAVLIRPDGHIAWRSKGSINQVKKVLARQLLRYE